MLRGNTCTSLVGYTENASKLGTELWKYSLLVKKKDPFKVGNNAYPRVLYVNTKVFHPIFFSGKKVKNGRRWGVEINLEEKVGGGG